jgi:ANTAR domain
VVALDDAQYETGEGPCMQVLEPHDPLFVHDVAASGDRWENFARAATEFGVQSTLSVHLPVDSEGLAASLNFYSRRQREAADEHLRAGVGFADQLAAALLGLDAYRSTAKLARDLAEAMRSRAVIEQAKGILMADKQIDADAAFQHLVQLSQHANIKVREVARRLVEERTRPG